MLSHKPLLNSGEREQGSWIGFLCDYLAAGTSGGRQHPALCPPLSHWLATDCRPGGSFLLWDCPKANTITHLSLACFPSELSFEGKMAWSMDFVEWERGRRMHLLHHQIDCLHPTLGGESRAHILDALTPLVVESLQMGEGISGGLSEVFPLLIKEAVGLLGGASKTYLDVYPSSFCGTTTLPPPPILSGVLVPWSVCSQGMHCTGREGSRDLDRSGVGYQLSPHFSK